MLLLLSIIVAILWLFGFAVFHIAGSAIHLLLLIAVIGVIVHFVRLAGTGGTGPVVR